MQQLCQKHSQLSNLLKRVALTLLIVAVGECVYGQFKNNDWYISPKISFADYSNKNDWNGYSIQKVPPISLSVEKGVTDYLSAGALLGISRDKYVNDTLSSNVHRYSEFAFGGVANLHFAGWIEKWSNYNIFLGDWDFYAGLSVLMNWEGAKETDVWNAELQKYESNNSSDFSFSVRPLIGVRYFVNDNFCMLLEVGEGNMGLVTTGITFRIPSHYY
ncbi:hypothetical protein [Carboxylicivirga taeanensis]|uniref:hypothetical protein n=1 Tax=Carboxylicivirga taeanensis TaxID=1416875 RepID=UPI003F6DE75B